jgi:hypothetical protein
MSGGALIWRLAKFLQATGLLVVLVGVVISIDTGMDDDGLTSMRAETLGLALGGGLFLAGWVLERAGRR